MKRCSAGQRRLSRHSKARSGGGKPPWVDAGTAGTACLAPGWGLWHDRGAQLVAQSRVSGRRQDQQPWPGAEAAPAPRAVAADVQCGPRHGRCAPPPSLLSDDPTVGESHPQATGGYHSAVLLTMVPDLEPTAVAAAYDGRARIAATFCQDKQALGLVKRRQHTWEAQHVVLLFARLAHHIVLWSKRWLSRVPTTRWR